MNRLTALLTLGLCALTLWLEAIGASPGGPALTFAIGALVGLGSPLAMLLALISTGTALGDADLALLTPGQWVGHISLGIAMGLVCRQAHRHVRLEAAPSAWAALGLCVLAAVSTLLPDDLLTVLTSAGDPMTVIAVISEPELATSAAVSLPLVIQSPSDLDGWVAWTPLVALFLGWFCAVAAVSAQSRLQASIPYLLAALGLLVLIPAVEDLLWLASDPNVLLPDAQRLSVEFGLLGGGERGVTIEQAPMQGFADLSSRPGVAIIRVAVALGLFMAAARRWRLVPSNARHHDLSNRALSAMGTVLLGLVAAVGFSIFISPERLDLVTLWGPSPVVFSVIGGTIITAAAGFESLRADGSNQMTVQLYILSLCCWIVGLLSPLSGWMAG